MGSIPKSNFFDTNANRKAYKKSNKNLESVLESIRSRNDNNVENAYNSEFKRATGVTTQDVDKLGNNSVPQHEQDSIIRTHIEHVESRRSKPRTTTRSNNVEKIEHIESRRPNPRKKTRFNRVVNYISSFFTHTGGKRNKTKKNKKRS